MSLKAVTSPGFWGKGGGKVVELRRRQLGAAMEGPWGREGTIIKENETPQCANNLSLSSAVVPFVDFPTSLRIARVLV